MGILHLTGGVSMEFRYFNGKSSEMTREEINSMEIWNPTMEHILAQTIERIAKDTTNGEQQETDNYAL